MTFSSHDFTIILVVALFVIWMLFASHRNLHKMFKREIREALAALTPEMPISEQLKLCHSIAFKVSMLCEFRTFSRLFTPKALKRLNAEGTTFTTRHNAILETIQETRTKVYNAAQNPETGLKDIFGGPIGARIEAEQAALQALLPGALAFAEKVKAYIK